MDYKANPHRDESSIDDAEKQPNTFFLKELALWGGRLVAIVLVFGLFVHPSYASIGSFLDGLFVKDAQGETASPSDKNSQTIPLLTAPLNTNPTISHRADISISEDGALSADNGPLGDRVEAPPVAPHDQIGVYVVRDGDTLAQIAKMFDVSKETIIWANDLKNGKVKEGQVLTILPVSGIIHTVKKGDTLASIAKKYKIDADDITNFNDLDDDPTLIAGDELIIPNGKLPQAPTPTKTPPKTVSGPLYAGYYKAPLARYVRTQGIHGNNGVDLAAPIGSPIYAAAAGTVVISSMGGWHGGYGNYVVVSHPNGTQTLYAHTSSNTVNVGDTVKQGDLIAYIGMTGRSTGPHVHFEVRGAKNPF